jgi:hypothetical protein
MAKGTIYGKTSDPNIQVKIEWESIPHPENVNSYLQYSYSDVSATLSYKCTSGGLTGNGEFSLTVCGVTFTRTKYNVAITSNGWTDVITYGGTQPHGDDGLATANISASGSIPGTNLSYHEVSGKATLDYIPQGSTIVAVSDSVLGEACAVRWVPNSRNYRYRIVFSIGEKSYTTDIIHPSKTTVYDYTGYVLPMAAAEEIPSTKGVMTATLYTYLIKGEDTLQIGEGRAQTFTVTVPDNDLTKPTANFMISPVNSLTSPFNTLYIGENTKVSGSFAEGKGKYGAEVVSYEMVVDGKSYGDPYVTDFLTNTNTGTIEVKGIVTDSRGYSRTYTRNIEVIEYNKPYLSPALAERDIICTRCDSEGTPSDTGTYLKIKARREYSRVMSGEKQKNFCDVRYRCTSDGGIFTGDQGWETILRGDNLETDLVDAIIPYEVTSIEEAYVVQVGVIDRLGNFTTAQFGIPTAFVTIDIPDKSKGRRIGIGRYAEDSTEAGVDMGIPIHGGGVDNLTLGERIIATSSSPINLNDITAPGNYYTTNGQYIDNSPYTGGGFTLEVRETDDRYHIKQTLSYGTITWLRHYNSTGWSGWIRLVADVEFADYVVEEGTDGGWKYKKWKNGTYEMHGTFDLTPAEKTTMQGATMYHTEPIKVKVPFNITTAIVSGSATMSFFLAEGKLLSSDTIGVVLFIPINYTAGRRNSIVSLHVTGEYK